MFVRVCLSLDLVWRRQRCTHSSPHAARTAQALLFLPSVQTERHHTHHNTLTNTAVGIGDFLASKGIKKAAVQRALDSLAAAGKLTAKVGCMHMQTLLMHAHAVYIDACMHGARPHVNTHNMHMHATARQEFGKTKIYLLPQEGLEVLSKEELDGKKAELKALQQEVAEERRQLREQEEGEGLLCVVCGGGCGVGKRLGELEFRS